MVSHSRARSTFNKTAFLERLGGHDSRRSVPRYPVIGILVLGVYGAAGCSGNHTPGNPTSSTTTTTGNPSASGTITTVAGVDAVGGYSGDGGAATSGTLSGPTGTYVDSAGNLYVADRMNNVVRIVNSSGVISTFAGTGVAGYSGDGGVATAAQLSGPRCIFGDPNGNVYVVESGNVGYSGGNVVREINTSGIISTIAGTGTAGFAGDGAGAVAAQLSSPAGGCIDSAGNMYIADTGNNRIRKVTASTGFITTIVGTGVPNFLGDGGISSAAALDAPTDVKVDSNGNLYIADRTNNRVRKVNGAVNVITTLAGSGTPPNNKGYTGDGGLATVATLDLPTALALDSSGNVYIADTGNNVIRKVTASTGFISTVVGNGTAGYGGDSGPATSAELKTPAGVTLDSAGDIYVSDTGNDVIRKVTQ